MNDLVSVGSAAKILNVSPDWVRKLEKQKVLKCYRTDTGQRLFRRPDVEALAIKRAKTQNRNV